MVGLAFLKVLCKTFLVAAVAHIHHVAFKMKLITQVFQACAQFIAKIIPHSNVLSFGANVVHLPFVKFLGEVFTITMITWARARPARLHMRAGPARLCVGFGLGCFVGSSCSEVPAQCIAACARFAAHLLHACAKIMNIIVPGHAYSSSAKK